VEPSRWGLVWIALGVLCEILGIVSDSWSIARLGLPIAILGTALHQGFPAPQTAVLAFGAVPLPSFVNQLFTPGLETALAGVATGIVGPFAPDLFSVGPVMKTSNHVLEFMPVHGGLLTAIVLGELGWYAAVRRGRSLRGSVPPALAGALLALVLHPLAATISAGLLVLGAPRLGLFWISHGLWISCSLLVIGVVETRPGRGSASRVRSFP
jgi:hypothetical protein